MSCGVGRRCGLDPVLLWLWCRSAAVAPIRPLAWKLPYATRAALKSKKACHNEVSAPAVSWCWLAGALKWWGPWRPAFEASHACGWPIDVGCWLGPPVPLFLGVSVGSLNILMTWHLTSFRMRDPGLKRKLEVFLWPCLGGYQHCSSCLLIVIRASPDSVSARTAQDMWGSQGAICRWPQIHTEIKILRTTWLEMILFFFMLFYTFPHFFYGGHTCFWSHTHPIPCKLFFKIVTVPARSKSVPNTLIIKLGFLWYDPVTKERETYGKRNSFETWDTQLGTGGKEQVAKGESLGKPGSKWVLWPEGHQRGLRIFKRAAGIL